MVTLAPHLTFAGRGRPEVEVRIRFFENPLPPSPPLFPEPFRDTAYHVLAYLHPLDACVIPAILQVQIPERYLSGIASSTLPVIRLQRSKTSVTNSPSRPRETSKRSTLPVGVRRLRV